MQQHNSIVSLSSLLPLALVVFFSVECGGWVISGCRSSSAPSSCLYYSDRHSRGRRQLTVMAAKKMRNKQADLLRKMELAKKQKEEEGDGDNDDASSTTKSSDDQKTKKLTDEEIRERNDRLRFEELLQRESSKVLNDFSSSGYLTKEQEEEEIAASRTCTTNTMTIDILNTWSLAT